MTYQNLGYWIGQANDSSTGRHPTGWVNGQRWSLTAGQWVAMYDQSQSDLASMTADRNAWQANANTAYDSGTWGLGTHWHDRWTATNNALSAMTADRDTWHSRADQAWGPSRAWNSGISFEAQRPPAGLLYMQATLSLPGLSSGGGTADASYGVQANSLGAGVSGGNVTIPKTGQYSIGGGFKGYNQTGNQETLEARLVSNQRGVLWYADTPMRITSYFGNGFIYIGALNAGEIVHLQFHTQFDAISGDGIYLLTFVPVLGTPS